MTRTELIALIAGMIYASNYDNPSVSFKDVVEDAIWILEETRMKCEAVHVDVEEK